MLNQYNQLVMEYACKIGLAYMRFYLATAWHAVRLRFEPATTSFGDTKDIKFKGGCMTLREIDALLKIFRSISGKPFEELDHKEQVWIAQATLELDKVAEQFCDEYNKAGGSKYLEERIKVLM